MQRKKVHCFHTFVLFRWFFRFRTPLVQRTIKIFLLVPFLPLRIKERCILRLHSTIFCAPWFREIFLQTFQLLLWIFDARLSSADGTALSAASRFCAKLSIFWRDSKSQKSKHLAFRTWKKFETKGFNENQF